MEVESRFLFRSADDADADEFVGPGPPTAAEDFAATGTVVDFAGGTTEDENEEEGGRGDDEDDDGKEETEEGGEELIAGPDGV